MAGDEGGPGDGVGGGDLVEEGMGFVEEMILHEML